MKSVIIGNAATIWMKEYIRNIHIPMGYEVLIITLSDISSADIAEYEAIGVEVICLEGTGIRGKINKTAGLIRAMNRVKADKNVRSIEIHYPPSSSQAKILAKLIKSVDAVKSLHFWGSDILRINEAGAQNLEALVAVSDVINIATEEMRSRFRGFYGEKYDDRFASAKFGSLAFTHIDKEKNASTREACKSSFGLNPDKITVAVGYNAKKEQQHLDAVRALDRISSEDKDRIQMLFHMVDSNDEAYMEAVEAAAKETGIEYTVIKRLMPLDEIARLRIATDIFLHAQVSDALSGTIRECIYAGAKLINPEWINYQEYDDMGVEYVKYAGFEELTGLFEDTLSGRIIIDTDKNASIVHDRYSWDAVRTDWVNIFNERIN